MPKTVVSGFTHNFLGNAPAWYKLAIVLCLLTSAIAPRVLGSVGLLSVINFL